jgi:hypothetical protein
MPNSSSRMRLDGDAPLWATIAGKPDSRW